ncbi:MAG TPA: hypothetical protein VN721_05040 [Flavipsychrobacter sp.]|nr:hypothetical protein [Flavipsychrobacter sp.]
MKKFLFATLIALIGLAQQVFAGDVVNNTSCDVKVTAVAYNISTCTVSLTCMSVTVSAHSSATLPGCIISSTTELLGFNVCWNVISCGTPECVSIGNSAGPYPCTNYPAGPVYLPTAACSTCAASGAATVKVHWVYLPTGVADLVIG